VNDTDPKEVLREARQLVKSQQYAAALEKYIWFHNHALHVNQSLAGVRLSYAISEWADLGVVYPPARRALESVRDAKTEALMRGTPDTNLFHDVASINRAFGQTERTRDLFKSIAASDRGVAAKCLHVALESLVHTKEFDLARSFMTDARKEVDQFAIPFRFGSQRTGSVPPETVQEALVGVYVKRVGLILRVFAGVGEESEADNLRNYAIERVPDAELRDRVMERLYPSPPSRRIQ